MTEPSEAQPASDARPSGNDDLAGEKAWLIERNDLDGADRHYFYAGECGSHGWTDDVHKATRFETETLANAETNGGPLLRAVEHSWFSSTALRQPTAASGEPAEAVMDALWPILGGSHTSAETWTNIGSAVDIALAEATAQPVSRNAVLEAYLLGRADAASEAYKHIIERPPELVGDLENRKSEAKGNEGAHRLISLTLNDFAKSQYAALPFDLQWSEPDQQAIRALGDARVIGAKSYSPDTRAQT